MKENMFFADEIEFYGKEIDKNKIVEMDDFPGKEDFIKFYTIHNGGDFIDGAWFFPESCYNSSVFGKSYITLAMFLGVREDDHEEGLNIDVMNDIITEKYKKFEDFVLFHIPFALDVIDNPFWIDVQTGEIKYIDFQVSNDPNDVITVASSFKNFCKCIRKRTGR
ncbi:MAG: hypothetical protein NC124_17155 [Clostridium sp.]|nr:hypothetical protein [Clostridium sp.]